MADNVQLQLEAMADELDAMVRTKMFTNDEFRIIKKRRTEFLNKLSGYMKSYAVYKEYIAYETALYRLIKVRRSQLKMGEKKSQLEHRILQRIRLLYETAMQRFPSEFEIFLNYFKFCNECRFTHAATKICEKIIEYHTNNEEAWLVSAKWFVHDDNLTEAMSYLKRALAIHKQSEKLYIEYIMCEVKNLAIDTVKTDDTKEKQNLLNERLKIVLNKMFLGVQKYNSYLETLTLLENYDCTLPSQEHVIAYLMEHQNNEHVWDYLAKREIRGFHYPDVDKSTTMTIKCKLSNCIKKYEEGLKKVPEEHKKSLMEMYLHTLVDISNQDFLSANMEKKNLLISAFNTASAGSYLSEEFFLSWLDLVNDNEATRILKIAMEKHPLSVNLWELHLRHEIVKRNRSEIIKTFELGVEALGSDSAPLWLLYVKYLTTTGSSMDEIESFYKRAILEHRKIADFFKPKYLELVALKYDVDKCREIFQKHIQQKPYCKPFYSTMVAVETKICTPTNTAELLKLLRLGIDMFGKDDVDVWLAYIEYSMHLLPNFNDVVLKTYNEAKQCLPEYLFIEFEDKYNSAWNMKQKQMENFDLNESD